MIRNILLSTATPRVIQLPQFDLIEDFGQSNALGLADVDAPSEYTGYLAIDRDVYIFSKRGTRDNIFGRYNNPALTGAIKMDFITSFVREWIDDPQNDGRGLIVVKVSEGGVALAQDGGLDWNANSVNELSDFAVENIDLAVDYLRNDLGQNQVRVLPTMWAQGESDARNQTYIDSYSQNLQDLIVKIRNTGVDFHFLSMLQAKNTDGDNDIRQIKQDLIGTISNYSTYDMRPFPVYDGTHHTTQGYIDMGADLYDLIINNPDYHVIQSI